MPNGRVKARVKFRDWDGEVRLVSKTAASRAAAERALKTELTVRRAPGGTGSLTAGSRVSALADAWLAVDHGRSTGTERTYRSTVRAQVVPALGRLYLREVTPGTGQPGVGHDRFDEWSRCGQDRAGVLVGDVRHGHRRRRGDSKPGARRSHPAELQRQEG